MKLPTRIAACLLAGIFLVTLTGCVYLRLRTLQVQLSDFPRYFSVETTGLPTVICKTPVLKESDVEWVTGLTPSVRQEDGLSVTSTYQFTKVLEEGASPGAYDELIFKFMYHDNRLTQMSFPVQFKSFLTERNFIEMLSPMQDAQTHMARKQTEWSWREMYIQIPSYEGICKFLGTPTRETRNDTSRDPHFRYHLKGQASSDVFEFPFRMDYRVWHYNNRMADVECNVGRVFLYIDVSKEDKTVKMDIRK